MRTYKKIILKTILFIFLIHYYINFYLIYYYNYLNNMFVSLRDFIRIVKIGLQWETVVGRIKLNKLLFYIIFKNKDLISILRIFIPLA